MARPLLTVAAATVLTAMAGLALAQQAPLPTNNPQAQANVRQSKVYNQVLRSNPAFRKKREQIECGPITDSQLRQQCIASFEAY